MDEDLKKLIEEQTRAIELRIEESYKGTASCFLNDVMPKFEDRMEEIAKSVAVATAEQVCLELTGEDFNMPERRRKVRESVQLGIKQAEKGMLVSNAAITAFVATTISIVYHFVKGVL